MAEIFINIIVFVVSLVFIIVIHELGHFATAKAFKVYVTEFSIGFGPALYTTKKDGKETRFSIRAIPLGGYCAMVGESMPELSPEEYQELNDKDKELVDLYNRVEPNRRLDGVAKWKRAIIMVAGVTLNFILGFVLLVVFYSTTTFATMYNNYVEVGENSVAEKAGWKNDDVIYQVSYEIIVNGESHVAEYNCQDETQNLYNSIDDLYDYSPTSENDVANYVLITDQNKEIKFSLNPIKNDKGTYYWPAIGITFSPNLDTHTKTLNVIEAIPEAAGTFGEYSVAIVKGIGQMFTPEGFEQMGGMISIFQVQQTMMELGFGYVINLWAMISINLGIFNLLPFPGLDGWHFLVIIIESITKKELPKKFKDVMSTIGMILLFGLMIVITCKDIFMLF